MNVGLEYCICGLICLCELVLSSTSEDVLLRIVMVCCTCFGRYSTILVGFR